MRSLSPCALLVAPSLNMPDTPYVGMPAGVRKRPSVAPELMVGMTATPGIHVLRVSASMGPMTSLDSGGAAPGFSGGGLEFDFHARIADGRDEFLSRILRPAVAREHAAIDVGRRALRQGIRRVAARELRGDAVGAQDGVRSTDPS